jgi:hypothetical protein
LRLHLKNLILFFFFNICFSTLVYSAPIGKVSLLKGQLNREGDLLRLDDIVNEGDVLETKSKSFAKIKLNDKTMVSIGPNSKFDFKQYRNKAGKRRNIISLIKGKVRVLVNKKAKEGESIKVKVGAVALGVRGTEILLNAYRAAKTATSDVALLTGNAEITGPGFSPFDMKGGQYFNAQDLSRNGLSALKKISPKILKKLMSNPGDFLPQLQDTSGKLKSLTQAMSSGGMGMATAVGAMALGAALIPDGESSDEGLKKVAKKDNQNTEKIVKKAKVKRKKSRNTSVEGVLTFKYKLKTEPWDIRDAIINRRKNVKDNKCFYYFYKRLPGAGEDERFRRKRDCDDYDFDL